MRAMRRLFALGGTLAVAAWLVVGAALAGGTTRQPTDAQNHRAAINDASGLLTKLLLPAGAAPASTEPAGDGHVLAHPAFTIGVTKLVDKHAWWTVHAPLEQVFNFVRDNPPRHGTVGNLCGAGGNGQPQQRCLGISFPARSGVLGVRQLVVELVALGHGSTGVRADAEVQWIIVRPASERVPPGVGEVEVARNGPNYGEAAAVGDPATVRKIIRLFDALPVLQPGSWSCPAIRSDSDMDTFSFRPRGGGPALARAFVRADVGRSDTGCDAMSFSIGDRRQMPLVGARRFLLAVGHLLQFRLTQRPN